MSKIPQSRSYNWQKLQSDEQCNRHVSMYQNKFIRHYFINDRLRNPFLACSKHDQSSFRKYHKSASKPKHTSPKTARPPLTWHPTAEPGVCPHPPSPGDPLPLCPWALQEQWRWQGREGWGRGDCMHLPTASKWTNSLALCSLPCSGTQHKTQIKILFKKSRPKSLGWIYRII